MTDLLPLRDRIKVAPEPALPDGATGVTWRRMREGELDAIHALFLAMDRVDRPGSPVGRGEVAGWTSPGRLDMAVDTVIAEADGRIVAVGLVPGPSGWTDWIPIHPVGGVHPDLRGRGIGRALLAWQILRAQQRLAEIDASVVARVVLDIGIGADAERLALRHGFVRERVFLHMVRDLAAPVEPHALEGGIRATVFEPAFDDAVRVTKNAVFADHWRSQPESAEHWAKQHLGPHLHRELSRVAFGGGDRIAGFVVTWFDPDRVAPASQAYVELVGVDVAFRGRGVARSLLTDVLAACARAGLATVALDVDGASPTGADRLYASVGFDVTARIGTWTVEL